MAHGATQDNHPARPALEALVAVHPEGMLHVMLGEFQIADGDFEKARDSFLIAIETPSLLRDHQEAARLGVIAPAAKLALVLNKDREKNLRQAVDAIRGMDPSLTYLLGYLKLFTQI